MAPGMPPVRSLACRKCGRRFQPSERAKVAWRLRGNDEQFREACPSCGFADVFGPEDYASRP